MYDDLSLPGGNGNTIKVVKHQQIRNRRDYSSKCKTSESDYKYEPSYIFSFIWKLFNIWVNKKDKTNIKFESIKQLPKFMHNEHFVKICDDNVSYFDIICFNKNLYIFTVVTTINFKLDFNLFKK